MTNQSLLPNEKKYPERFIVSAIESSWDVRVSAYEPPVHPKFETVAEKLHVKGIVVANEAELRYLAKLSTDQAREEFGEAIRDIRHPLGRTGINGTGAFYEAGKSRTADMAILRDKPKEGLQIALVYNRGKWRLPGGFTEPADQDDLKRTAIREGFEETGIEIDRFASQAQTIIPEHVKPNSSRSIDLAYVMSQVEAVILPDPGLGDELNAQDDAEAAEWADEQAVHLLRSDDQISTDHYRFAIDSFEWAKQAVSDES